MKEHRMAQHPRNFIVSAGIMLALALVLLLFHSEVELTCDRAAQPGTCTLMQASILQRESLRIPLDKLQGATLQERHRRGKESTHRVVLLTQDAKIPLTHYLVSDLISPYSEKQALVSRVNEFVQSSQIPSLQVRLDDRWFFQIGGLVLLLGSGVFGLLAWRAAIVAGRDESISSVRPESTH